MMTRKRTEEQMGSLDSPETLAFRLGLALSPTQSLIAERFQSSGHGQMDCSEAGIDPKSDDSLKILAVCALWRLMANPGSKCTVVSSDQGKARKFMDFLERLTVTIDPGLEATVSWPRWNVMRMHGQAGYEIRYVSTACSVDELAQTGRPQTVVVLEARSSTPRFHDMVAAVARATDLPGCKVVRLW